MLAGLLVVQAMKHAADMQVLEDKIQWLESIEPPKCVCESTLCPERKACPECQECPTYWDLCN